MFFAFLILARMLSSGKAERFFVSLTAMFPAPRTWQTTACRTKQACSLCLYGPWAKRCFYILFLKSCKNRRRISNRYKWGLKSLKYLLSGHSQKKIVHTCPSTLPGWPLLDGQEVFMKNMSLTTLFCSHSWHFLGYLPILWWPLSQRTAPFPRRWDSRIHACAMWLYAIKVDSGHSWVAPWTPNPGLANQIFSTVSWNSGCSSELRNWGCHVSSGHALTHQRCLKREKNEVDMTDQMNPRRKELKTVRVLRRCITSMFN